MTRRNPLAEVALAGAIATSRRGRKAPERFQRQGRIDRRTVHRVPSGDCRVFKRQTGVTKSRIRVTILLDHSTSMNSRTYDPVSQTMSPESRQQIAAQVVRDLAGATDRLPYVKADLVAFTTSGSSTVLYPLWQTGEPTSMIDQRLYHAGMGGTDEGHSIAYVLDDLILERDATTASLIIIVSDGEPSRPEHVRYVAGTARDQGIPVVSVAIVPLNSAQQEHMYGRENVVNYDPNPKILARGMAKAIGRVL